MRRLCLVALLSLGLPAQADIFDDLTGVYEAFDYPGERCHENPGFISFSPDRKRISFAWASPVPSYTGEMITGYAGTVVERLPDGLIMLRDNESRLDPAGNKVLWVLTLMTDRDGYCWTRKDWPPGTCLENLRCKPVASG